MPVQLFMLICLLGLVVLFLLSDDVLKIERVKENWKHEFTLSMQAKKPLFVSTEHIEGLANYYIESGEYLRVNPFEAANKELLGITSLKNATGD